MKCQLIFGILLFPALSHPIGNRLFILVILSTALSNYSNCINLTFIVCKSAKIIKYAFQKAKKLE